MEKPTELPELSFYASAKLTYEEEKQIAEAMRNVSLELPAEHKKVSWERLARVDYAMADIWGWLKDRLKLDANNRVPEIRKIKFFSQDDWGKIAEQFGYGPGARGFNTPTNEILIADSENEEQISAIVTHELIHCFSRRTVRVNKQEEGSNHYDVEVRLYGFTNPKNVFRWFNEIMTDTIAIEAMSASERPETKEAQLNLSKIYKNGVVFLDMVFEKMSEKTGRSVREIRDELYSAYFTGDTAALKVFKEAFGPQALQVLSSLKDNQYPTGFLEIIGSQYFDIDREELRKRVQKLESGERLTLNNGVTIGIAEDEA